MAPHDDVAHLNAGSLQHHGQQALALARAFANGPLPRQQIGDAVFFELPGVGLVVYSEKWAIPLALFALALTLVVIIRSRREATRFGRDVVIGAAATVGAVVLSAAAAYLAGLILSLLHVMLPWGGAPALSPVYWAAVALLSLAISTALYVTLHREQHEWASCWSRGNLDSTFTSNGSGCTRFELSLHLARLGRRACWTICGRQWATDNKKHRHVPSGVSDGGAIHSNRISDRRCFARSDCGGRDRRSGHHRTNRVATRAITRDRMQRRRLVHIRHLCCGYDHSLWDRFAHRAHSDVHPVSSVLIYAIDVDSSEAWLASRASIARTDAWTRTVLAPFAQGPEWIAHFFLWPSAVVAKRVPSLSLPQPAINVLSDSTTNDARQLSLGVQGSTGTTALAMRVSDAQVISATIDGRAIDPTRYRLHTQDWVLWYWAPSDSGALLSLVVPAGSTPKLEVLAYSLGIPTLPGITILPRPANVVPVQSGDVTIVCRRVSIPPSK